MKIRINFWRLLFVVLPFILFLSLFPNNIFVSITIGLILLGVVYHFSYAFLFHFTLIFLIVAPFFWIADYQEIAESLVDFAFFFLFAGVIGELIFPSKDNNYGPLHKTRARR